MNFPVRRAAAAAAIAVSALLAACGGGGSDITPAAQVTSVKVVGDSLADSGAYGLKFTVQGTAASGAGSSAIWPERVAASYGQTLCPHYDLTGASVAVRQSSAKMRTECMPRKISNPRIRTSMCCGRPAGGAGRGACEVKDAGHYGCTGAVAAGRAKMAASPAHPATVLH